MRPARSLRQLLLKTLPLTTSVAFWVSCSIESGCICTARSEDVPAQQSNNRKTQRVATASNRLAGTFSHTGGRDGSREVPTVFQPCIGTMNQIGTPLPALSPQGGERVAEGGERAV